MIAAQGIDVSHIKGQHTVVLLLTATINPGPMPQVARNDPETRLHDYRVALDLWLQSGIEALVFVENSGYDLKTLEQVARRYPQVQCEFLSLNNNRSALDRGKGYGEMMLIEDAFKLSSRLRDADLVAKCTGRLTLRNYAKVVRGVVSDQADIHCTLKSNLSFADSRFFIARPAFFQRHLVPRKETLSDKDGFFFEHALACAATASVAAGEKWRFFRHLPYIAGVSGTFGVKMTDGFWTRKVKTLYHAIRLFVYAH